MRILPFKQKNQSGDTIIEVMLAMSILTLVLLSSWAIVNRATQLNLAAQKRVEMVNALKEQAEILRAERDNGKDIVGDIPAGVHSITPGSAQANPCDEINPPTAPKDAFIVKGVTGAVNYNAGFKQVGAGRTFAPTDMSSIVWVQYTDHPVSTSNPSHFADFYVRGCWQTSGGKQPTDSSQFVMRLNL